MRSKSKVGLMIINYVFEYATVIVYQSMVLHSIHFERILCFHQTYFHKMYAQIKFYSTESSNQPFSAPIAPFQNTQWSKTPPKQPLLPISRHFSFRTHLVYNKNVRRNKNCSFHVTKKNARPS